MFAGSNISEPILKNEFFKFFNAFFYPINKIINFINGMVSLDENRFIGFNKENDFLNKIPDKSSITRSNYNLNGVLYNLNFIVKKEGVDNENG